MQSADQSGTTDPALPQLVRRGKFLAQVNGKYWTAIGASDFNLLNRYTNGQDITPQLAQRAAIGFNLLRVFTVFSVSGIGDSPARPALYEAIPTFLQACARHGCSMSNWWV